MTEVTYEDFYNEDGTRRVDPLTKIGIMLAIRELARKHGAMSPIASLEWALARGILAPRADVVLERGKDDLVLTPHGQEIVGTFWLQRDRERLYKRKGLIVGRHI